jgi:hypothetical protein
VRNISFAFTKAQVLQQRKWVTRRTGWKSLKPGTLLCGVEKAMGLRKGEQVVELCTIRVLDVRRERLDELIRHPAYGLAEMVLEGFPQLSPEEFIRYFFEGVEPSAFITRIQFEYVGG